MSLFGPRAKNPKGTVRGGGTSPPGMIDPLAPWNNMNTDEQAAAKNELAAVAMTRNKMRQDNALPDHNIDRGDLPADFSATPDESDPLKIYFVNTTPTNQAIWSTWDFGDEASTTDVSTLSNPDYTYATAGTYTVTLLTGRYGGPEQLPADKTMVTKDIEVTSE